MIVEAIKNLVPNAKFHIYGNFTYDDIEWQDSRDKPSKADVDAEIIKVTAEWTANQYQRDRQYPSIGDQLDMQYHDELDGTTTWKDAVAKVKADNPKG